MLGSEFRIPLACVILVWGGFRVLSGHLTRRRSLRLGRGPGPGPEGHARATHRPLAPPGGRPGSGRGAGLRGLPPPPHAGPRGTPAARTRGRAESAPRRSPEEMGNRDSRYRPIVFPARHRASPFPGAPACRHRNPGPRALAALTGGCLRSTGGGGG